MPREILEIPSLPHPGRVHLSGHFLLVQSLVVCRDFGILQNFRTKVYPCLDTTGYSLQLEINNEIIIDCYFFFKKKK